MTPESPLTLENELRNELLALRKKLSTLGDPELRLSLLPVRNALSEALAFADIFPTATPSPQTTPAKLLLKSITAKAMGPYIRFALGRQSLLNQSVMQFFDNLTARMDDLVGQVSQYERLLEHTVSLFSRYSYQWQHFWEAYLSLSSLPEQRESSADSPSSPPTAVPPGDETPIQHRLEPFDRVHFLEYADQIARWPNPVVVLGASTLEHLEALRQLGKTPVAVTPDQDFVRACRERGLQAVAEKPHSYLQRAQREAGTLLLLHFLHTLELGEIAPFVESAVAALAPGGMLAIEETNPSTLDGLRDFHARAGHRTPLHPDAMVALLKRAGISSPALWIGGRRQEADRLQTSDAETKPAVDKLNEMIFGAPYYCLTAHPSLEGQS
jgi:hypothetical protein